MRKDNNTPKIGMIAALGAVIAAIWLLAIYGTIQEAQETKYDVRVRPGAVSYGTRSSATIPMVSAPARHTSVPMISGSAVRSYAHYGHASYTLHPTPYTIHTTSSATVHTIGSGGGTGGVSSPLGDRGASPSGDRGASSRGITYGGASVSLPSLALVTPVYSSSAEAEAPARNGVGPRRAKPTEPGTDGQWSDDGKEDGDWWYYDYWEGKWLSPNDGDTRPANDGTGNFYKYVGTYPTGAWVLVDDQGDPVNPTPLTDAPWLLLLLALAYAAAKKVRAKRVFLPKVG